MRPVVLLVFCLGPAFAGAPTTKAVPVTENLHGVSITDPYRWLEDQNSPETRAWIAGQTAYTRSVLGKVPQWQGIRKRLGGIMKVDTMNRPQVRNGRYFFEKRRASDDQSILYMRQGAGGSDSVLLDPNSLSPDHSTSIRLMDISRDGKLVAYGLRQGGQDELTIRLRDADTRRDLADTLPSARYMSVSLRPDKSGIYYAQATGKGPRVYYHALAADPKHDEMVFGEQFGPTQIIGCKISGNERWLICQVYTGSAGDKVDVFARDLMAGGAMKPVITGLDARFDAHPAGDRLYVLTNWKAPNGRILAIDLLHPARENWKEIVAERKSVLDSMQVAGGRLAATWLENVHSHVEVLADDGKTVRVLELPSLGVVEGPEGLWEADEAFYSFNSLAQPNTIYRYSMSSGKQSVWFQQKSSLDPSTIELKQVWYRSRDNTQIPMFIAHKKGLQLDGSHPTLLTGYGGFSISELPAYSDIASAWIDLGGVYALPNLRGGGEFGEAWHRAGMLDKKQNVFDDFISAAEYLIKSGYTRKERLAIRGRSNGGLLVGAALTQRPDLFQAVICGFPLLDMIRYDQFKVAKYWVPEYGTAQDPKQFPFIYKYSPYQHVVKGTKYPAVLVVSGDFDTRVDPLHARKMAALLEASTGSDRPVLLRYDTQSGHSAGVPVDRLADEFTDEIAFMVWQFGMK